jgi:hypothetical protein
MTKLFWNLVKVAPVVLGVSAITAQGAVANSTTDLDASVDFDSELLLAQAAPTTTAPIDPASAQLLQQLEQSRQGKSFNTGVYNNPMSQVTSVNQLRDVEPTAWAYEALRSLVERYGCIVGYPDRTFRGDRALSRWEFAAGLNACLNVMERLIQEGLAVVREDIEKLKRLMQEFEAELAALGARVDNLEGRVSFLEDHQFSTTTKLTGEVIFAISNAWSGDYATNANRTPEQQVADNNRDVGNQTTFSNRVRLNFDTSFTGKDRLRTRLSAGNVPNLATATGTDMTRLGFDLDTNNDVIIEDLWYRFPIGDNVTAFIGTQGLDLDDVFNVGNPYLESSGTGALSRYSRRNALVFRGPEGAGAGIKYAFNEQFAIRAAYLADQGDAGNPSAGAGEFNGNFSTGIQFEINPTKTFNINITYLHSYFDKDNVNLSGSLGSAITRSPYRATFGIPVSYNRDSVGLQFDWQATDWLHWTAWGAYGKAEAQGVDSNSDLWTWNTSLSFLDLGKEGAVLSIGGGMLPKITASDNALSDVDTSYIVETLYNFPVTDNILLTPGFYVVFNPNHYSRNDTAWVGVLRTTFKF